jgi:hypothetical protein
MSTKTKTLLVVLKLPLIPHVALRVHSRELVEAAQTGLFT